MKTGIQLMADERRAHITREGWTPAHDAKHRRRELAKAAASYLATHAEPDVDFPRRPALAGPTWNWPWGKRWWKPSADPIRNLVKAGALIAAEIDRLQSMRQKPRRALKVPCVMCAGSGVIIDYAHGKPYRRHTCRACA